MEKKLVEVSDQEVRIDFALNCKCRANVRLRSLCATSPIAFKVQTSSPHKFLVNPPSGLVPPLSYATFQIILKPQTHLPPTFPRSPSDRFLIKTAAAAGRLSPDSVTSHFDSLPPGATSDFKLKVAFVGPFLLRHAVGVGDLDAVKNLVKRQRLVVSQLPVKEAESLLRVASELSKNSEDMVNLLVEAGLKIDETLESKGWSELHVAAAAFDRTDEVLGFLKRDSGPLDLRDREGRTPLHLAVSKGNIKCARALVEYGADKDAKSKDGRTALYRAAANGDHSMVEMLIEMGADPTIGTTDRGRWALDVARDKGHKEVAEILERGEIVLTAARRGDLKHLESLLQKGASLNYRDQYGLTALHAAAIKGHKEVFLMLVDFGLDLECQDKEGNSPLHLAVESGSTATVEVLVNLGADFNAKNKRGATPLFMARVMGYSDISDFLVNKGASDFVHSSTSSSLSSLL